MKNLFKNFTKNEKGATAIEYGLIAALIAVVLITAATRVGTSVSNKFNTAATTINSAGTAPAAAAR